MGNTQLSQPIGGFLFWQLLLQRSNLITSASEESSLYGCTEI